MDADNDVDVDVDVVVDVDVNVDVDLSPSKVDNWGVAIASSAIVWVGVGFIMRSVLALGGGGYGMIFGFLGRYQGKNGKDKYFGALLC